MEFYCAFRLNVVRYASSTAVELYELDHHHLFAGGTLKLVICFLKSRRYTARSIEIVPRGGPPF